MHSGSITFSTALDNKQLEKDLAGLTKKIEKQEQKIADLSSKRDAAKEKGVFDGAALDAEKAKLQEIKDRLADIRAMAKDKSLSADERERTKELIPSVQQELADQRARVGALQAEWNRTENAAERYAQKLSEAESELERQKGEAGALQQQIDGLNAAWDSGQFNRAATRIRELKASLQKMEGEGLWLGNPGYDEAYSELLRINEAAKDHTREIMRDSAYMEELAGGLQVANQHVVDLGDELAELQTRMRELARAGIGPGVQEYDYTYARIRDITTELKRYKDRLYAVGEGNYFSDLADSVSVSDERIAQLNAELKRLKTLQKDLERVGGGLGTEQYDGVVARIAEINRELKEYRAELTADPGADPVENLADSAAIADERIAALSQELVRLKAQKKGLEQAGLGLGFQEYDEVISKIQQITQELKNYQAALGEVRETASDQLKESSEIIQDLGERQKDAPQGGGLSGQLRAAEKMAAVLGKISKLLGGTGSVGAEAAGAAQGLASAAAGMEGLSSAAAAAGPVVAGVVVTFALLKAAVVKIVEEAKKLNQSFLAFLKKGGTLLKSFSKAAVKAFTLSALGAAKLLERMNVFPKMFSSIENSLKHLGRTVKSALVFSVIYKGLSLVRDQMGAYLMINAQFSTALRRLQGVLLTAFQPIYEVVVPALTTLINVLARAIAAVSQFIAVLFGKTAKQAQANAKNLYDQAGATTAAGNAAEDAAKQLAAFNEINKLEGNKSGGGGGGGGAVETGPLFDWEYEDVPFESWGEAFSAFLDGLLGNIPKLKESFKDFADWLNGLTKKLYDMFTFPGVLDKVKQLGRDLADALNYLVDLIDWYQLGQTLGAGLNLALNFLTSFLYGFNWIGLGRHLAELVNGLASEIDWYEFGRLLWSGFKIGLETLAGFLLGLDMPLLAQAASNIVTGFFTEMLNTIQGIPWGEIGRQIADFLVNLDWYGMLSAVTSAIAAGIMAAVAAVRGFLDRIVPEIDRIAGEIVQALLAFFREKVEWDKLAQAIGDGIAAALRFVAGLLNPELFYAVGAAIGEFLINLQWVEIFGGLAEALANGINAAIALVRGILDQLTPEKLQEIAEGIAQKINEFVQGVNWGELGQTLHDGIETALDFLLSILDQLDWETIGQGIVDFLSGLDWGGLMEKWGSVVGRAIGGALKAIDLSDALSLGGDIVAGLLKGIWNKFQEKGGVIGWIKELIFTPFVDGFRSLFQIGSPSKVMEGEGGFLIAGLANGISQAWHAIPEFFGEKLAALKQTLIDKWDGMKQDAKEKWDEIQAVLGAAWDAVKTEAGEKFDGAKQDIIDTMGKLKDHDWRSIGSNIIDGIHNGLKNAWLTVKNWASDAAKWLADTFGGAKNTVSNIANSFSGGRTSGGGGRVAVRAMPDATAYRIPALAQGAVIPPNREFLAVLGDQKNGTNLEAPAGLVRQMVTEGIRAAMAQGGFGNGDMTIIMELDGREFGRACYRYGTAEQQRVGVRLTEVHG